MNIKLEDLTLEQCWLDFSKEAIPQGAPTQQAHAMFIAYCAGLATLLQLRQAVQEQAPASAEHIFEQWRQRIEDCLRGDLNVILDEDGNTWPIQWTNPRPT